MSPELMGMLGAVTDEKLADDVDDWEEPVGLTTPSTMLSQLQQYQAR